jgi:hypothetical protein
MMRNLMLPEVEAIGVAVAVAGEVAVGVAVGTGVEDVAVGVGVVPPPTVTAAWFVCVTRFWFWSRTVMPPVRVNTPEPLTVAVSQ